jgi:hypothetical protein
MHLIPLMHVSPPSSSRHRSSKAKSKYSKEQDSDDDADGMGPSGDEYSFLNIQDAIGLVRDQNVRTEAPVEVEKAAFRRIERFDPPFHSDEYLKNCNRYPEALNEHVHTAYAWLPIDIARALSTEPKLVQKPVETFYTRDALQLRVSQIHLLHQLYERRLTT